MKISKIYLSEFQSILERNSIYLNIFHRNFSRSNNSLPQLSYIPTCYFGESAATYWKTKDYGFRQMGITENRDRFRESLQLEEPDIYKYKKCKKFSPKPADSQICHTFNGMELGGILKASNWINAYQEAFTGSETEDILKSKGVDTDNGFLFSLDTMQSYFITKRRRWPHNIPVNSFLIKVHQAGDIPWVKDDKSSWTRISSHQNEMATHFISVKGEKVINTVS